MRTDSEFNTLNPQYPTSLNLNLTQPLWRGLRFDENRHRLQVARKNRQLSAEQLRQRVIEMVTQAVQAYWELDYACAQSRRAGRGRAAGRAASTKATGGRPSRECWRPSMWWPRRPRWPPSSRAVFAAQQALTQAENNLKIADAAEPQRPDVEHGAGSGDAVRTARRPCPAWTRPSSGRWRPGRNSPKMPSRAM